MSGNPKGYPHKDEVAGYLKQYAEYFNLHIQRSQRVIELTRTSQGSFLITTTTTMYQADRVIVATGPFQLPYIPAGFEKLNKVKQIHSSRYRNPGDIRGSRVLVVGGGNSAVQIAEELAGRFEVSLSVRHKLRVLPARWLGKSIAWWAHYSRIAYLPTNLWPSKLRGGRVPIVGGERLKTLIAQGIISLLPAPTKTASNHQILFEDGRSRAFDTVVWATGYTTDFSWIRLPEAFDNQTPIITTSFTTPVAGLYFLGLEWQRSPSSATFLGVGKDAKRLIKLIDHNLK